MKTKTASVLKQLEHSFLPTAVKKYFTHNQWLEDDVMSVYVRRSRHRIGKTVYECLDVASASVHIEHQRQGLFKAFLAKAHELHPWQATYVENVNNPDLRAWFEKQPDWERVDNNPFSICFYKLK